PLSETMVTTSAISSTTTIAIPISILRVEMCCAGPEPEPPPVPVIAGLGARRLAIGSSAHDRPGGDPTSAGGFGTSPDSVGLFHHRCEPPCGLATDGLLAVAAVSVE